jgi:bisphosphoglycerate-independent phosphoglycerate mutase (AlkP superfamily)
VKGRPDELDRFPLAINRLGLIVHHTDAEREYAYDRNTPFGRLEKAPDAAALNKWHYRHEERLEAPLRV